jgi:hypothetical protein
MLCYLHFKIKLHCLKRHMISFHSFPGHIFSSTSTIWPTVHSKSVKSCCILNHLKFKITNAQNFLNNFHSMKNVIFWDVSPCGSCRNRHFQGMYRLHLQDENIVLQSLAIANMFLVHRFHPQDGGNTFL